MTNEEFIRALAEALTRLEDATNAEARDILYELALRIYALLATRLPEGQLERVLAWPRLREALLPLLASANDGLTQLLLSRVAAAEAVVLEPVGLRYGVSVTPRPVQEVLDAAVVLGTPLPQLFARPPGGGSSAFMAQLLRLLERSIVPLLQTEATTEAIARRVIERRTRAGRATPLATKGTVANAWRERFRAITSAAIWSVVTPAQLRAAAFGDDERSAERWEWRAVLDPRTCPVCRPLDNTRAATPEGFPEGPPPLHPLCRCIVVPLFT